VRPGLLLAVVLLVPAAAGCGGTRTVTETETVTSTVTVDQTRKQGAGPPEVRWEYGYVKSLTAKGSGYVLRFDPAWLLSGETANVAAAEDGAVEPGQPVPNDNYVLDEGHRLLTYVVPPDAHVTVITRHGDPAQLGATPITVAELAKIVDGTSTMKLFEPLDSGTWITVDIDTVRRIDQQYRP
jgi:hypothetical protein